ncbi:MAG: ABC transporter ATP-binding protein [Anaerolineales bacterium]|nr:ABC transporter ATP-binding protein [Anaerolineales bacterium]
MSKRSIKNADLFQEPPRNRLRGLFRILTGYRLVYLLAIVSIAISSAARTGYSLWLRYFVDDVLPAAPVTAVFIRIAAGFILLALVQGGLAFASQVLAARSSENVTQRLRNYMFDHIQRLSFSYHDQMPSGDLITRCSSDIEAIRRFFSEQAIGLGRILMLFAINFSAILALNVRLGLYSVVAIPLIVLVSYFFFKRVSVIYEAYQEQEATLSNTLLENLSGVRVVKAFARQSFERDKFDRENWKKYLRGKKLLTMFSLFWPSSDVLCGAQLVFGLGIGAMMAIRQEISVGTYLAYAGMIRLVIWPIRNLGRLIVNMSTAMVSYDRVATVLRVAREPIDVGYVPEGAKLEGHLVFDQVAFHYGEAAPVLTDISFECQPGQAIALLGSTGSGKTSLVNLVPRFYEYTGGRILLDGVELNQYSAQFLRRNIGIVEQEPFLFSRSIRENITYGVHREVTQEEIESAARAAAIHDAILSFPEGYDTLVGERGVTLSGGQKQRVAIARTLIKDPRILILDDSTSSVDTETEASIRFALELLMQGRSSLIIAHRIQSVENADLILVLDEGRIVQRGTHATLVAQDGLYRRIHALQTRIEYELESEISGV